MSCFSMVDVISCHKKSRVLQIKKGQNTLSQFTNLCLDPDVVELCLKNTGDIRNNREDNSSRTFQKAPVDNLTLPVIVILVKETNNSALHV